MYAYVGNNPVNYVDPTGHTATHWQAIGQQLEYYISGAWDLMKNNVPSTATVGKDLVTVIPDFIDKTGKQLIEVKNVAYQYLSRQIQAEIQIAKEARQQFVLVVREGTKVSKSLKTAIGDAGGTIVAVGTETLTALTKTLVTSAEVVPLVFMGNEFIERTLQRVFPQKVHEL